MKTSKQVEQELEEVKARYEFLTNRRTELEDELNKVEQELRPYRQNSYNWRGGNSVVTKREVK